MKKIAVFALALLVISLFVGVVRAQESQVPQQAPQESPEVTQKAPPEAVAAFDKFLEQWLVKQDIDAALAFVAPEREDAEVYRSMFHITTGEFDFEIWIRKVLVMWLFSDHGIVNDFGHGDPQHAGYANLPTSPDQVSGRKQWRTVNEATSRVLVGPILPEEPNSVMAAVILKHVSKDAIVCQLRFTKNGWKIVKFIWMVG